MTADPGAYDVPGRSLEARHEAILAEWEAARVGQARGAAILTAADLGPVAVSLTALQVALDATAEACGLPAGVSPSVVEFKAARDRELAEVVRAWREVDRVEFETAAWWDALLRLRDAADRYAGLGIGDVA